MNTNQLVLCLNIYNNKYMHYTKLRTEHTSRAVVRRAGSAGAQQIRTRYAQAVKHCTVGAEGSEGPCRNSRERNIFRGHLPQPAVLRPRPAVAVAQLVARADANPRPCGSSHTGGAAGAASRGIEIAGGGSHPAGGGLPGAGAGGSAGTGSSGRGGGSSRPGGGTGCGGCFGRVGSLGGASLVATSAVALRTSRALFMPTFLSSGPLHAPASEEGIMLSLAVVLFSQERVIGPTTWTKT